MKLFFTRTAIFLSQDKNRRNLRLFLRFMLVLFLLVFLFSLLFLLLTRSEGRDYSWFACVYWTVTTMSTLGNPIVLQSDAGRLLTLLTLFSGIVIFMLLLPFILIRLIYTPWLEASRQSRVPRFLPEESGGHALILGTDDIAVYTAERLNRRDIPCFLITADQQRAMDLLEQGFQVLLGEADRSATYINAQARKAALVLALHDDLKNTGIAATVRNVASAVTLAASAGNANAEDILRLAGCDHVFNFTRMLGRAMGRRVFGGNLESNSIASFEDLHIAEARIEDTALEGKSLRQLDLRAKLGLNVAGIWQGSEFIPAHPDVLIDRGMVLLLAGTRDKLDKFDEYSRPVMRNLEESRAGNPVLVLGGGRVGRAVLEILTRRNISFTLLDKNPAVLDPEDPRFVRGDAADIHCLREAGLEEAHSLVLTTGDDDLNIYLTLYCRKLRPETQIIVRCNLSRNIKAMYSAGASLVMALSSLAMHSVLNILSPNTVYLLTEGLNIFRLNMPDCLVGKSLRDSNIRQATRCNVVAMRRDGKMRVNQDPDEIFAAGDELIIIGSLEAEQEFMRRFPQAGRR